MIAEEPRVDVTFANQLHDAGRDVNHGNVQEIVEHWNTSKYRYPFRYSVPPTIRKRHQNEHGAERHQQKKERCRILCGREKCEYPGRRISMSSIAMRIMATPRTKSSDAMRDEEVFVAVV